jgi:putative FmdB family regulatory protein
VPIYEFYCESCNTVFSFFSSRIDTAAAPACPRCGRPELPRNPSRFAGISKKGEGAAGGDDFGGDDPLSGLDDDRMAGAMESLAAEMEGLDESAEKDPKQMMRFFERFQQATGLEAGPKMEEMMARLAEGADVDELEERLGGGGGEGEEDAYGEGSPAGGDDDFADFFRKKKEPAPARRRPTVDETLYFL